jgi:uncharacterized membrane protein
LTSTHFPTCGSDMTVQKSLPHTLVGMTVVTGLVDAVTDVQKVYPRDHSESDFLYQSNHSLAAAGTEPFWNIRVKREFAQGNFLFDRLTVNH